MSKDKLTLTIIPADASDADLEALVAAWKLQAEVAAAEKKQVTDPSQTKDDGNQGASNQNA